MEILVRWTETRDWEQALYAVIPKRKFLDGGKVKQGASREHAEGPDNCADTEGEDITKEILEEDPSLAESPHSATFETILK
jgi:tRNA (guanine9-N1)-methyltransferase